MITKIRYFYRNQVIVLVGTEEPFKNKVFSALSHSEGTRCWDLWDVRYSRLRPPLEMKYTNSAENIHASAYVENEEELEFVTSLLRKYQTRFYKDHPHLTIIDWCPMNGFIKGSPTIKGYSPFKGSIRSEVGYFSRKEGLERLKKFQEEYLLLESFTEKDRIINPDAQPLQNTVTSKLSFFRNRDQGEIYQKLLKEPIETWEYPKERN